MKHHILLIALAFCGLVYCQAPIPKTYDGHKIGSVNAPVLLEAFMDLMCPDSAFAWPVMKQLMANYGPDKLLFNMHLFPLPYHHNAFYAARGSLIVEQHDPTVFWKWVDEIFAVQEQFYNGPTRNSTAMKVIEDMGLVAAKFGVPTSTWLQGMIEDSAIDEAARVAWKFATTRGVYGTPVYLVNGVWVPAQSDWNVTQWKSLLDPVM